MPIYEYRCSNCSKRFAKLVGVVAGATAPACPKCGSADVAKLVSRFTRARGEEEIFDSLENAALGADDNDPKAVSRIMKEMGKGLAEDDDGSFDEYMEEAEREVYDATPDSDLAT